MINTVSSFIFTWVGDRLQHYPNLQKITANLGWLSVDYAVRLVAGLLVGAWVARYLGPLQFGQFSYALAIVALFAVPAGLGLEGVVGRNLIRSPLEKKELLGTSFLLRLAAGAMLYAGLTLYAFFGVSDPTLQLLLVILGGTLFHPAVLIFGVWFGAQYLSKYMAWCQTGGFLIATSLRIGLLLLQRPLVDFAYATLAELVFTAVFITRVYAVKERDLGEWKFRRSVAAKLLYESWPLILAGMAVVIYVKIDQVMLGQIRDEHEVGIYAAAVRVSEIWYVIPTILASSLFPSIVRSRDLEEREYHGRLQHYYNFNATLAYSLSIPMTLLAPWIIRVLYGSRYGESAAILMVHIWASLFVFLGVARGGHLLNEGFLRFSLFATGLGAVLNVGLNFLLIPRYAGLGAAVATVISYAVSAVFSGLLYRSTRPIALMQLRALVLPWSALSTPWSRH